MAFSSSRGYWDSGCSVWAGALHGGAEEGHLSTLHSAPGAGLWQAAIPPLPLFHPVLSIHRSTAPQPQSVVPLCQSHSCQQRFHSSQVKSSWKGPLKNVVSENAQFLV